MPLRTEDCVKYLVTLKPGTKPADWKRRSKCTVGPFTVRQFENVTTGLKGIMYERDDKLSVTTDDGPGSEMDEFCRPGFRCLGSSLSDACIEETKAKIFSMPMDSLRRAIRKANRDEEGYDGYTDDEIRQAEADSLYEDYTFVVEFMHALGVKVTATVEWVHIVTKEHVFETWPWTRAHPGWRW